MSQWIDACATDDIDEEDLIAWEHEGKSYAIYNTEKGFFASDLMCTHE
ncbi:Rieske 2Fe-2S domain-containing protein, partial [Leisingera sp. F5]